MLSLEEARQLLVREVTALATVELPLAELLGAVAAEDLVARLDLPGFDTSAMDGFALACRSDGAESDLEVAGEIPAGDANGRSLAAGQTFRIMTGAPLPTGADTVVPVEEVLFDEPGAGASPRTSRVRLPAAKHGQHVRHRGEICARGTTLIGRGMRLAAPHLALAAAAGLETLLAFPRPRVAILATGDELVEPGQPLGEGSIFNSNTPYLAAALTAWGLEPRVLPVARDTSADLAAALADGLDADLLLVTGGVSAGSYDLVEPALEALGAELLCDGVAIRPGKPVVFARRGDTWVLGLPGNPQSAAIGLDLFGHLVLDRLQGVDRHEWNFYPARLAAAITNSGPRHAFLLARATLHEALLCAAPVPSRGSHDLWALARANCWISLPPTNARAEGDTVEILPLGMRLSV